MSTSVGFTLVRGGIKEPAPDGSQIEPQCFACRLQDPRFGFDPKHYQKLEDLRLNGKDGRRVGLATIAEAINEDLATDPLKPQFRLSKVGLSKHFRCHTSTADRASYAVTAAHRSSRPALAVRPGVVLNDTIREALPAFLRPGNALIRGPESLAENIEELERVLNLLEQRIDGNEEVLAEKVWVEDLKMAVTKPLPTSTALAAYGHISTVMQKGIALLDKVSDPRHTVAQFLFRVLRTMQHEVIRAAQTQFAAMARDCAQEPDADRWRDWCVRHGTEFAKALDAVMTECDRELIRVSEEVSQ